jgi:aspartyl-tRNA(Asn)/glutamyl-tRNA(Gln) amidotransferase subunit A
MKIGKSVTDDLPQTHTRVSFSEIDPSKLDMIEAADLIEAKKVSPVELTRACLERIEKFNPLLNAFITVTAESALSQAKAAEDEINRGQRRGILHGIPIALKDIIEISGVKTTAASAVYAENIPRHDAEIVSRLKQAGAVFLGKLNLHEFAYGGSGVISHYGPVRNPWNTEHITGGSSSGSAAAVAAGLCFAAVGTDTSGSIRLPAALCGIVGLKPSYGLVSVRGVIPLSWSYDHVGPMTRTVADAAAFLQVMAGYDQKEIHSAEFPAADYVAALQEDPRRLRIGISPENFCKDLDQEVDYAFNEAQSVLKAIVADIKEIIVPVDEDRTVFKAESYAFHQGYLATKSDKYQPETLNRIRSGSDVSTTEYILKMRELRYLRRFASAFLNDVDLVLTPTCPVLPPKLIDLQADPKSLRSRELVMLRNTRPFNVLGLPTISIPCGFSKAGLPIGMQITGAPGADALVLSLASAFERETEWHKLRPAL